jgi:hypothetical protein
MVIMATMGIAFAAPAQVKPMDPHSPPMILLVSIALEDIICPTIIFG